MQHKKTSSSLFLWYNKVGDFMKELTNEHVLHIAHLARIAIEDDEILKYKKELEQIMNEINKINEINIDTSSIMISPSSNKNMYRTDECINEKIDIQKNAPKTNGNYIEVSRVLND